MFSYRADGVNQALQFALEHLLHAGVEEASRNGPVIVAPGPVMVELTNPRNRVLYSPTRDANHVFHVMETLWMLSGSRDIEFPVYFNSTYGQFSDDEKTMWDAYGWRWREFFGYDQLDVIIEELRKNPTSRRCVLSMWNGGAFESDSTRQPVSCTGHTSDLHTAVSGGKAVPCNTHAYLAIRSGKLNLTVMNRSNDTIWGAFGANTVHFTFLLEYLAMRIGVPAGSYYLFTNNLHVYTDKFDRRKLAAMADDCAETEEVEHGPSITDGFDEDLKLFMPWALSIIRAEVPPATWSISEKPHYATTLASNIPDLKTPFMWSVVVPMFLFWVFRKWKDDYSSTICLDGIDAPDWQLAVRQWVERRKKP